MNMAGLDTGSVAVVVVLPPGPPINLTSFLPADVRATHNSYMEWFVSYTRMLCPRLFFKTAQYRMSRISLNNESRTDLTTSQRILQPCFAMHKTLKTYQCRVCYKKVYSSAVCQCVRYQTIWRAYKLAMLYTNYATTTDNKGFSVLHWICFEGWWRLVDLLLQAGADVDGLVSQGNNRYLYRPMDATFDSRPKNSKVIGLLMQHGCKFSEITLAAFIRYSSGVKCRYSVDPHILAVMRQVMLRGVSLNRYNDSHPLAWAIRSNNLDLVRMLIHEANVNVNEIDLSGYGCKSLAVAWFNGCEEMLRLLLASGARVDTDFYYFLVGLMRTVRTNQHPIAARQIKHSSLAVAKRIFSPLNLTAHISTPLDFHVSHLAVRGLISRSREELGATKQVLDSIAWPRPLMDLCVMAVRRAIGQSRDIVAAVGHLTVPVCGERLLLPESMKKQLLLHKAMQPILQPTSVPSSLYADFIRTYMQ